MKVGKIVFGDDKNNRPLLKDTLYEKYNTDARLRDIIHELDKSVEHKKVLINKLDSEIQEKIEQSDNLYNMLRHTLEQIEIECLCYDQIILAQQKAKLDLQNQND